MRERAIGYGLGVGGCLGAASAFIDQPPSSVAAWAAAGFCVGALLILGAFLRELAACEIERLLDPPRNPTR